MKVRLVATKKILDNYDWMCTKNCAIHQMLTVAFCTKDELQHLKLYEIARSSLDWDFIYTLVLHTTKPRTFIVEFPDELEQYANPDYIVSETTAENFQSKAPDVAQLRLKLPGNPW